jgi:glycosyltransferase involved in cell wall biosynthesis
MSSIKVSIIVPVYNGERFISKCIDSIICQTLRNIEIICVNDGSTDMSLEILKRYADKDNRIKIISTRNKGQGNARNIAIEHAVGEFIGFVDIDDWVDPEMFEELYSVGNQFLCDVVISEFNLYNERTKKISQPEWCKIPNYKAFDNRVFIAEDIMDYVFKLHSAPWSKIYRTQFIKSNKVKFPVGLYYEDISFVFK